MKFQFFTNISHEFRTPLTLILTPLETLIKQQSDMVLKKKLDSIYQNAHLLLSLVNQLLDFRKLEIKRGESFIQDRKHHTIHKRYISTIQRVIHY